MKSIKFNFVGWNIGGKLIFIGLILAFVSLFLPYATYVDTGNITTVFESQAYVTLIFFIYPIFRLLQDNNIGKILGSSLAVLGILYQVLSMLGILDDVHFSFGIGFLLYTLSFVLLLIGIITYEPYQRSQESITLKSAIKPSFRGFKFNFNGWNIGGKLIFASLVIAVVSVFLPWANAGIVSRSGLQSGYYIYLLIFVYPIIWLLQDRSIGRFKGLACSVIGIVLSIITIMHYNVEAMGQSMNISGSGLFMFLISSVILGVGILKYSPYDRGTDD